MVDPTVFAQAGESTLEVEEPDLVIYRLRGVLEGNALRAMRKADASWGQGKPYLLVLVDISEQVNSTPDARKVAMEPAGGTTNRAVAFFGGNRHVRILADLVMRASRLLSSTAAPVRFFDDEASARSWLVEQRPELMKHAGMK